MIIYVVLSFLLSVVLGIIILPILKKIKASQIINDYLERHRSKKNTPTMGGIIFIISTLLVIVFLIIENKISITYNFITVLFVFISYFIIGFIDDYLIIKRKTNKGLTENQKFIMQTVVAIVFFYLFLVSGNEPFLWLHIFNLKINIGFLYGLFILFVLIGGSNAVNLTDGLDGLATGLSIISFITMGIITLNTVWLEGYYDISIFCFVLVGSLFGFLLFNKNPAKVFMGDTGSLTLGATLSSIAILTRHEVLLIIIGIVFVIETISVIIQVSYYKLTRKRVFLMAPLHHHLEYKGLSERKIVRILWIIGILGSVLSLLLLKGDL